MRLPKLNKSELEDFEQGVVLVKGKHMNRTALGIVDAIFCLYPNITFRELKQMLPDDINPSTPKNYKSLFVPYHPDRKYGVVQPGTIRKECIEKGLDINASHFAEKEETFITSDGVEVLVSKSWESSDTLTGENDLQNLINHVHQYGIVVNSFESKTEPFKKGNYELYIVNNALYNKIRNFKKGYSLYWWSIGIVLIIMIILYTIKRSI